jgi:hypothetical protein
MAPLIELQKKHGRLNYAYLHYDLLDRAALTTIIFKVKSPHIDMLNICKMHVCEDQKFQH